MSNDAGPAEATPWRDRRFVTFATGNFVNNIGEAVYMVALPLLVYDLTGSLVVMSLLAVLNPATLLLGPLLGVVADRYGSRALVVPGLLVQLVAAVGLNVLGLGAHAPIWPLFVFGAFVQIGGAAYRAGWMTGVARMFPDKPVRARGSLGSLFVISTVTGPLVVSLGLDLFGYYGLLWFNAVTFLAPIAVWLIGIHPPRPEPAPATNAAPGPGAPTPAPSSAVARHRRPPRRSWRIGPELAEGWRILRARPIVLNTALIALPMVFVASTGTLTLATFHLRNDFRMSAAEVGGVLTVMRVGALLGTLAVSERRRFDLRRILLFTTVGITACLFGLAASRLAVVVVALVLCFTLQGSMSVAFDMMIIKYLPVHGLGRAGGLLNVIEGTPVIVAPLVIPLVVRVLGTPATFVALGALGLLGIVQLWRFRSQWRPAPIPDSAETTALTG